MFSSSLRVLKPQQPLLASCVRASAGSTPSSFVCARSISRLSRSGTASPAPLSRRVVTAPINPFYSTHWAQSRGFADSTGGAGGGKKRRTFLTLIIASVGAGAGYYLFSRDETAASLGSSDDDSHKEHPSATAKKASKDVDYYKVYKAVADIMEDDYEDGSYGPVFVRLAWHASGTYSKLDGTGGSNGATMRFAPESNHGANAGLYIARDRLEKVKKQFPDISYGDLWTLAGVCAIQEMGGPTIKWRPGRVDVQDGSVCTPDGRLPDAAKKQDHVRDIFYRMGFNDQEIVALVGAHALGRCHTDRSGYDGPWTPSPTMFTNDYFNQLLTKKWVEKKWKGPKQSIDKETGELMMLPADLALVEDKTFRKYVEEYAKDNDKFFKDFAAAYGKLLELGVKFKPGQKEYTFPVASA